jgi:HEAT repeat protein
MNRAENSNFETILETALGNPESFQQTLAPHLEEPDEAKLNALLRVLESAGVVSKQLVSNLFVEKLGEKGAAFLSKNLDIKRPALFIESAGILGTLQYEPALEKLKAAISSNSADLVLPAVRAISLMKPSKMVDDILVDFYLNYEGEDKLFSSIRFLLPRHETLVHEMLEKYRGLKDDRKMWVLKFLAETGNPEALRLFSEELDAAPLERGLYCISGLGRIKKEESVKILVKHIKNPEWFLRKRIAEALGQTMHPTSVEPVLGMIEDESVQVRAAAVESLSKVGNLKPQLLLDKLRNSKGNLKVNLIRAMGQLKNEMFLKPLIDELKDRKSMFFTIDALGDLGFAEAEIPLRRILKDAEWFNRLNALEALAKLPLPSLGQIAQEQAQDENDMVRNSAARILASKQKMNGA